MLAATRLIALHKNKGMTVAACLKNRTDYIENPDKTEQGQFVSSYACSALTADEEFMLSKRQYDLVNGRRQKSDVIAYQIRQSFRPGEITAEEANKVGYELAMRFTKGTAVPLFSRDVMCVASRYSVPRATASRRFRKASQRASSTRPSLRPSGVRRMSALSSRRSSLCSAREVNMR